MKVFTSGYTFASLHSRDYRLLWLAQLSTSMGQWMDQMTRGWLMYQGKRIWQLREFPATVVG